MTNARDHLQATARPLKTRLEELTGARCVIHVKSQLGWPGPVRRYEVVVESGDGGGRGLALDPQKALQDAFEQAFENCLEPVVAGVSVPVWRDLRATGTGYTPLAIEGSPTVPSIVWNRRASVLQHEETCDDGNASWAPLEEDDCLFDSQEIWLDEISEVRWLDSSAHIDARPVTRPPPPPRLMAVPPRHSPPPPPPYLTIPPSPAPSPSFVPPAASIPPASPVPPAIPRFLAPGAEVGPASRVASGVVRCPVLPLSSPQDRPLPALPIQSAFQWRPLVLAASVGIALALGLALFFTAFSGGTSAQPEITAEPALVPRHSHTTDVRLHALPSNARVMIDNVEAILDGNTIPFPSDGREHHLMVQVDGHVVWQQMLNTGAPLDLMVTSSAPELLLLQPVMITSEISHDRTRPVLTRARSRAGGRSSSPSQSEGLEQAAQAAARWANTRLPNTHPNAPETVAETVAERTTHRPNLALDPEF